MYGSEDQQIAMIFHKRNDALVGHLLQQSIVAALVVFRIRCVLLAPGARDWVDVEAQLLLVFAPAPAAIDAPDLRSGRVGELA
ncbi:hypothetical protein D9M70_641890 [compost metagenome]